MTPNRSTISFTKWSQALKRRQRSQSFRRCLVLIAMPVVAFALAYWIYLSGSPTFAYQQVRSTTILASIFALSVLCLRMILQDRNRGQILQNVNLGLCPRCGYDIRATSKRCPECGGVYLELLKKSGVCPGRDARRISRAIPVLVSYCFSVLFLTAPGLVGALHQFGMNFRDDFTYVLHDHCFNSNSWKNARVLHDNRTVRVKMVFDLMSQDIWVGTTPAELANLLGAPDLDPAHNEGRHAYFLQEKPGGFFRIAKNEYVEFNLVDGRFHSVNLRSVAAP